MATRTAITINSLNSYATATSITQTAGDAANDHSIDARRCPNLILRAENTNVGAAVAFDILLTAGGNSFGQALTLSYSVAASSIEAIRLDIPADLLQSGSLIHIDSTDANFGDMLFEVLAW